MDRPPAARDILRAACQARILRAIEREPVIYREEVAAILVALADLVVDLRAIRRLLEGRDEEEEEEDV